MMPEIDMADINRLQKMGTTDEILGWLRDRAERERPFKRANAPTPSLEELTIVGLSVAGQRVFQIEQVYEHDGVYRSEATETYLCARLHLSGNAARFEEVSLLLENTSIMLRFGSHLRPWMLFESFVLLFPVATFTNFAVMTKLQDKLMNV